jgi:plasmid stabilization system protein ParE
MTAEFHPLAASELIDAAVFYEGQAPGLGRDFVDEIERLVAVLRVFPEIGREHAKDLRSMPARRFPYTVVYQVFADRFRVLAIAHQRRKPSYWAGRIR